MEKELIRVEDVSKSYRNTPIFDHLTIAFEKGKSYGIMGHNGSGKSVLLKLIAGYAFPDSGRITVNGRVLKQDVDFIENAGVVINAPEFIGGMSAVKNLRYLSEIRKTIGPAEIDEVLRKFGLYEARNKKVSTYSQGMKQRLRLAQALMEEPEILLLDEPMNALDKEGVAFVKRILKEHVSQGKTLLFTSHNREDFEDLADVTYGIGGGMLTEV